MADKEILSLTVADKPDGTESIHSVQGGNSRRITTDQIAELGAGIITDSSTSRTLVIGDAGKWIRFTSASPITCTIDVGIFSAGDEIAFEQAGAGVVTFTAGAGFTINSADSLVDSNGQFTIQGLKFISASQATLFGSLA